MFVFLYLDIHVMPNCDISSALVMEILQSCPSDHIKIWPLNSPEWYISSFVQDCSISSALAMEIHTAVLHQGINIYFLYFKLTGDTLSCHLRVR